MTLKIDKGGFDLIQDQSTRKTPKWGSLWKIMTSQVSECLRRDDNPLPSEKYGAVKKNFYMEKEGGLVQIKGTRRAEKSTHMERGGWHSLETDWSMDEVEEKPRANERHLRSNSPETELVEPWKGEEDAPEESEPELQQPQVVGDSGGYNWQSTKSSLKERFTYLFNNEILSDVHFVVGKEPGIQRIPAHKLILTAGSAVFDAMFNGTLATRAPEIELPDVEPTAFLSLLRFLYSDEVQIGPESVMTTLYTAKKYAVPSLERHCVEFLKSNLSADNAFMLLTQARLFDEPQLASLCLDTIDKTTSEALAADGFTDVDLETLCAVLERDTLHIRETTLFQSVMRWCENRCARHQVPAVPENMRSLLGRGLSLVRFPLMTVEEFAQGPAQSGLLTDRELVSLFLYFTVNPKPPIPFRDTPRCSLTGKEQAVHRFLQVESRWGYSGASDRIRFSVDKRIFIVGFGLYGSIHGAREYEAKIQVLLHSSCKICGSNSVRLTCDGSGCTFRVMFKEPIEIRAHTNYIASATIKGPDTYYGTQGVKTVTVDTKSGPVTFQFMYAAGNNNGTNVEDGQIPEILFYT